MSFVLGPSIFFFVLDDHVTYECDICGHLVTYVILHHTLCLSPK